MIEIDGQGLALTDIVDVARSGAKVQLSEAAAARMQETRAAAEEVTGRREVYGRTTGVGANRSTPLAGGGNDSALRLLRSHSATSGEAHRDDVVRAMLLIRVSQLAAGGSGVSPEIARAVIDMLNSPVLPVIRSAGGIGTGDLHAFAATALTLRGERAAAGGQVPAVIDEWTLHDALPFISSNALTLGRSVLALADLETLIDNGLTVSALSFLALNGNAEAYGLQVAESTGSAGSVRVAEAMRRLVHGSGEPARIQDPYCLRTIPQLWGAVLDEVTSLRALLSHQVVAAQENPLILATSPADVAHHGAPFAANLALRVDSLRLGVGAAAGTSLRRLALLSDPAYTGLGRFLTGEGSGSSGVMMAEYVAASALGTVRACANPVSLQTTVVSLGGEEDATFAPIGVDQFEQQIKALRTLISAEFLCAVRAMRQRASAGGEGLSSPVQAALLVGGELPADDADRDLTADLQQCEQGLQKLFNGESQLG